MTQLTLSTWRPLSRPPRQLWVRCWCCRFSSINEDKSLKGWTETATRPRLYRCDECSEAES